MKNISTLLTKGLTDIEKKQIEEFFNSNQLVLEQITKTLKEKLESSINEQRSKQLFTSNSWPYFQADSNGYQRAISEILTLLQLRD